MLYIAGMNVCDPVVTVTRIRIRACERDSTAIQVGNPTSGVAHPDKRWGGIGH